MNKPNATKKTSNSKVEPTKVESFRVLRAHAFDNGGVTFDVQINGINIYGCHVVEGKNGDFISYPQRKGKDGKYYSIVWVKLSDDDTAAILQEVERIINE